MLNYNSESHYISTLIVQELKRKDLTEAVCIAALARAILNLYHEIGMDSNHVTEFLNMVSVTYFEERMAKLEKDEN